LAELLNTTPAHSCFCFFIFDTQTAAAEGDRSLVKEKSNHEDDAKHINNRNDSESIRGRILRRQNVASSPTTTDDVTLPTEATGKSSVITTVSSRKREANISPSSSNSNGTVVDNNDHIDSDAKSKKRRKTVTFDGSTETTAVNSESDTSKRLRAAAQLAREERSRRRRDALAIQEESLHAISATGATSCAVNSSRHRKADSRFNQKKKASGTSASNVATDTADVVRVPMLTGTLILYRGTHPRAVFIRRV
jgi:hypothetical protein